MSFKKGFVFVTLSAIAGGLAISVTKLGLNAGVEIFSFLFFTSFFALVFATPLYLRRKRPKLSAVDIRNIFIVGVGAGVVSRVLFYIGQSMTTAINTNFIITLGTISTILFAFLLLGTKPPKKEWLAAGVMFAGVYLVATSGTSLTSSLGDLFVLGSALVFGFTNIVAKKAMETISATVLSFWRLAIGVVALFFLVIFLSPNPLSGAIWLSVLNGFLLCAMIFTVFKSIDLLGPSLALTLLFMSPVFGTVFAIALLGESINAFQLAGAAMVLLGAVIIYVNGSRAKVSHARRL